MKGLQNSKEQLIPTIHFIDMKAPTEQWFHRIDKATWKPKYSYSAEYCALQYQNEDTWAHSAEEFFHVRTAAVTQQEGKLSALPFVAQIQKHSLQHLLMLTTSFLPAKSKFAAPVSQNQCSALNTKHQSASKASTWDRTAYLHWFSSPLSAIVR